MKKLLVGGVLVGSLGLNLYLIDTEVTVSDDLDSEMIEMEMNDEITVAQSAIQKKPKVIIRNHKKNVENIANSFFPDERSQKEKKAENQGTESFNENEYQEKYDQAQKKWKSDLSEFLERDLGLTDENLQYYHEISMIRNQEISDFIAPKLENSPDGSYMHTVEDQIGIAKINEKFLKLLKQNFGEKAYNSYVEFRNLHNKLPMEGEGENRVHHFVEF